jgi:hypothetical protein
MDYTPTVLPKWHPAQSSKSVGCGAGVAGLALDQNERGDEPVERCPLVPPFPRHLLLCCSDQVAARPRDPLRSRRFLRNLYAHRRKNLRGAQVSMPGKPFRKDEVDAKLAELGIEGTTPVETLDVEQHLRLCGIFG